MKTPVVIRAGVRAEVYDYCMWTDGKSTLWRIKVHATAGGPAHYVPVVTAADNKLEARLEEVVDSFLEHHRFVHAVEAVEAKPTPKTRGFYNPEPEPTKQEEPSGHHLTKEAHQDTLVQPPVTEPVVTVSVKEVEPPKPRRLDDFWTNKRR